MGYEIRFRPVILGDPPAGEVFVLWEEEEGQVTFWDSTASWAVPRPLANVVPSDLPPPYNSPGLAVRILPIQYAKGRDGDEAMDRLIQSLEATAEPLLAERAA